MSFEEDMARLRAQMDQARESLREAAAACWAFYEALVTEGFNEEQALQLTIECLVTAMQGSDDA